MGFLHYLLDYIAPKMQRNTRINNGIMQLNFIQNISKSENPSKNVNRNIFQNQYFFYEYMNILDNNFKHNASVI